MVVTRYYFHATDGYTAVFDRTGWRLLGLEFEEVAAVVAQGVRRRFGALADLTDWLIVVQADNGDEVATYGLEELSTVAPARLAAA